MTIAIESANGELASRFPRLSVRMFSTLALVCDRGGVWGTCWGNDLNRLLISKDSNRYRIGFPCTQTLNGQDPSKPDPILTDFPKIARVGADSLTFDAQVRESTDRLDLDFDAIPWL